MSQQKQDKKQQQKNQSTADNKGNPEFSEKVERIYKIMMRLMSWIVGSAIFLVIVLFYFNSPVVDTISQVIFYIGIVTLILFLVIELIGDNIKNYLSRITDKNENAKSPVN